MANEKFIKALYDALIPEYTAVMRDADDTAHEFSPKFEKRMKKLIKRRNKPYYKLINTIGKRVACIAVIILVASSVTIMSVEAVRNAITDFLVSIISEKLPTESIILSDDKTGNAPQTIEELYDITYDLSEYKVVNDSRNEFVYWKYYRNTKDNYTSVELKQYVKKHYFTFVETGTEMTPIDINGHEAIYYFRDNIGFHMLIWDNGEYIICLKSNVDKNTLLEIAESVQKVE